MKTPFLKSLGSGAITFFMQNSRLLSLKNLEVPKNRKNFLESIEISREKRNFSVVHQIFELQHLLSTK